MIWEKKEIDNQAVKDVSSRYKLDLLTASIFVRRNVLSAEEICFFLEDDVRFLNNPFLFEGMNEAVDRINAAVESGEKILVYGDRDVDGITSTVMMTSALRKLGGVADWSLPTGDESYGLTSEVIEKAAAAGITLLITVDCGISNLSEIELASENGIDTIIVDHHNPHEYLPDAVAVINPKLEESKYPFRDLCGCTVTSKLLWALDFSATRYYDIPITLFNIVPANEGYTIEAVKLLNLVEIGRMREVIIPGVISFEQCKLSQFIDNGEAIVYNADSQGFQFEKIFGNATGINMVDIQPAVEKSIPGLAGKSLLKIKEYSKLARYTEKGSSEMDVLKNLVISHILKTENSLHERYIEHLEFAALGTLADIMPLVNENRIIVKQGLAQIAQTKNQGLRHLLFRNDLFGKPLSSKDISWNISPVINAAGRMGEPEKAARLFLSTDQKEIEGLVEDIIQLNKERKALGEKTWKAMIPKAQTCFEKTKGKMVMIAGKNIHRGITGIISARLVAHFKISAIVIALLHDKAVGSMRSSLGMNSKAFLHNFEDMFNDFGGHDMAAGFSLPLEKLDEFTDRFYSVVDQLSPEILYEEKIDIDAEIPLSFLTPELWKIVQMFEPYGEANAQLTFLTRGLKVKTIDLMGKKDSDHVKMLVDTGSVKWPAVIWNGSCLVGKEFDVNDTVDAVYHISKNIYQNIETLRLTIVDIKKT